MTRSWVDDSKLPFGDSRAIRMADVAQCAQYIQKYAQISTDEALDRTNEFCHRFALGLGDGFARALLWSSR